MKGLSHSHRSLAALACAAVGSVPAPLLAQEVSTKGPSMEEIIVTARKRVETLQEAPVAISVMTWEQIENTGSTDVADLTKRLPNVAASYPGIDPMQTNTAIRDLVTGARNIGFDSGFGIFIDGGYAGRLATGNKSLPDVERIEFLPGPQATLFGKNTTLGVMNIVETGQHA